ITVPTVLAITARRNCALCSASERSARTVADVVIRRSPVLLHCYRPQGHCGTLAQNPTAVPVFEQPAVMEWTGRGANHTATKWRLGGRFGLLAPDRSAAGARRYSFHQRVPR